VALSIRTFLPANALAALALAIAGAASAQDGPVRILVGFAPSSTSDVIARMLVDRMKTSLGVPVIVDNRPGANGFIAAEALKNARPDGKTLMIAPIAVTVFAPLTHANLRYDPVKDFAPVSLAANFQFALAVGPASAAKTLPEHVAWLRANPAKAAYGLPLVGGPGHFLGVMVGRATGVDLAFVPYKGSAPLVTDLIGGQVPAAIALVSDFVKLHQSGKLAMLAVFGPQRSSAAPDVPTFQELGFAAIEGGMGWHAFHTTAGTPRPAIDRLSAAIAAAIEAPEVSERLIALGLEPVGSTPDELARRVADDIAKWGPAVKASGFRADE
jgi:tripartite-type tricarboxylate transporter receptor subunit TctC